MKKIIFLVLIFCFSTKISLSQAQLIAVQHPTLDTAIFYTNIQQAIDSAWNGSSIYLPAIIGDYSLPGFIVHKKLHIYGVGHYPDSTAATGRVIISGNILIRKGADSGSISGLYINGNVNLDSINNFYFYRNRLVNFEITKNSSNLIFNSNLIMGTTSGGNSENCIFENNFFGNSESYMGWGSYALTNCFNFKSTNFRNNIFFYGCGDIPSSYNKKYVVYNLSYCLFENNIFLINDGNFNVINFFGNCSYNTFNNNIFETANPIPYGSNLGQNNIVIANQDTIFAYHVGNIFNYQHNYKLHEGSPGVNNGTDGTDIGIYGGETPYKVGALPIIPHFLKSIITPNTVKDGKLKIEMIIDAQKR